MFDPWFLVVSLLLPAHAEPVPLVLGFKNYGSCAEALQGVQVWFEGIGWCMSAKGEAT